MGKTFNDLFDDFFNEKKKSEEAAKEHLKNIITAITNFKRIDEEGRMEEFIDQELGEPDEIKETIEDNLRIQQHIWNTNQGKYIKIIILDLVPEDSPETETLEEQLEDAVENEDYSLAIKLRDQIKKSKKKK